MRQEILKFTAIALFLFAFTCAEAKEPYKNTVKLTFLSWTSGCTKISYERAFSDIRQSAELCGSIIGAGYDTMHGLAEDMPLARLPKRVTTMASNFGTGLARKTTILH